MSDRQAVNAAGTVLPINGGHFAGWSVYFGKGEQLNAEGAVFNGPQTQENADITAVIEAIRLLRKKQDELSHKSSQWRILTASADVEALATVANPTGHAKVLQDELELAKENGFDILVDQLKGEERSKNHDEAVYMAEHAARNHNRGH